MSIPCALAVARVGVVGPERSCRWLDLLPLTIIKNGALWLQARPHDDN